MRRACAGLVVILLAGGCAAGGPRESENALIERYEGELRALRRRAEQAEGKLLVRENEVALLETRLQAMILRESFAETARAEPRAEPRAVPAAASRAPRPPATTPLVLDAAFLFPEGSAVLKREAATALDRMAQELATPLREGALARVECDPTGEDGRDLAVRRALAVVRFLEDKGLPAERLAAASRPAPSRAAARARAAAPRVEVVVEPRR